MLRSQNNESLITIEYSNTNFTFVNEIGGLVEITEPYIAADLTDDELRINNFCGITIRPSPIQYE